MHYLLNCELKFNDTPLKYTTGETFNNFWKATPFCIKHPGTLSNTFKVCRKDPIGCDCNKNKPLEEVHFTLWEKGCVCWGDSRTATRARTMVWKPGRSWHQRQSMSMTLVRLLNSIVFRSIFSASSTFQSRDFRYLTMLSEREKECKCYTRQWWKFLIFASVYNIAYVESLGKKSSSPSIGGTSFILSFSDCILFSMLTKISQT